MSEKETCQNCRFYAHRGGIPGLLNPFVDFQGECRRRSPEQQVQVTIPMDAIDEDTGEVMTSTYTGSFPLRMENDWCGEWEQTSDG